MYTTDQETLEAECVVEFVKASGPGGQHRNKRETGVRLTHPPSGLTVMATERRSQARNRALAFERLIARLDQLNEVPKERKATSPPPGAAARRLREKRRRARRRSERRVPPDES